MNAHPFGVSPDRPPALTSFGATGLRHYVATAVFGSGLALMVTLIINKLEARHAVILFAGALVLAGGLVVARRLPELLLYLLALLLPFTSIEKTFFITADTTFVVSGIAIGPADLALIGLYMLWFARIALVKREGLPRPTTLDVWIAVFIGVHLLSAVNSVSPVLTIYETIRLTKYALLCFYLEHNIRREHLKFMIAGLCLAIVLQSALGVVQQRTGRLLGIGRTKGAQNVEYEQYTVTGFEAVRRAEGTTFDSHALALFFAMSLAVPFGIALTRGVNPIYRGAAAFTFVIGLQGLIVSFARAGWVAFAGSIAVLLWFLMRWREWRSLGIIAAIVFGLGVPAALPFAGQIRQRLFEAPPELVTARFETIEMGWEMFKDSPITGVGANAYMRALELKFSIFEGDPYFIPAHNMFVFVLTELGVLGAAVFLGLAVVVLHRLWGATTSRDPLLRILAVTLFGGYLAFLLQGLSDPIYATNVTYFLLWFLVGIGAAVARLAAETGLQSRRKHNTLRRNNETVAGFVVGEGLIVRSGSVPLLQRGTRAGRESTRARQETRPG